MASSKAPALSTHSIQPNKLTLRPLGPDEIRILVIHPGEDGDPVECSLVHVERRAGKGHGEGVASLSQYVEEPQAPSDALQHMSLGAVMSPQKFESDLERETEPPGWGTYEALSYMWGPLTPCQDIKIDGMIASLRDNLFKALKILRLKDTSRRIWTDALCINQEDIPERSMQVPIMNRIYRQTETVLVWLGEAGDDSDLAFDCFNSIVDGESGNDVLHPKGVSFDGQPVRDFNFKEMKAIWAVCHRDYWGRVWIIQEILCASKVLVLCGNKTTSVDNMLKGIYLISDTISRWQAMGEAQWMEGLKVMTLSAPGFEILRSYSGRRESTQSFSIWDLLELCRTCRSECEDIRDRIYGLVGLLEENEWQELKPDYNKTTAQVYVDVLLVRLASSRTINFSFLVSWDKTLLRVNQLLKDPLWHFGPVFVPLRSICRRSQLRKLEETRSEINIAEVAMIVQISPIIQVTSAWIPNFVDLEGKDVTLRDVHLLQTLGARYSKTETGKFVFNPDPSLPPSEDNVAVDAYRWPSSGRCRGFMAWDGHSKLAGLASCELQRGDVFCNVSEVDGLCLVVRPGNHGHILTVIGRAILMANQKNKFYKILRFKTEPIDSNVPDFRTDFRSYKCDTSVAEIFFLTR